MMREKEASGPMRHWIMLVAAVVVGAVLTLHPGIDIVVSDLFFEPENGFAWRSDGIANLVHEAIQVFARVIGVALLLGTLYTLIRSRQAGRKVELLGLGVRKWVFLFLSLVIAPGLVANTLLKDNFGRARPFQVAEFGGPLVHSPPLVVTDQCEDNCSFVAGDPALGFWLHSFAYVVGRRSRLVLAGGIAAGGLAGLLRIAMGAHFFSDVLFAGAFMLGTVALLHAVMFGRRATAARWRSWMGLPQPAGGMR
ncbi:phosphatase PAP2 family protein [Arenibaculum sp.]|uniref:phosphatase PAP2 family protein n=1 Tax=Arenibaculum sp. TaxID=2865862 RepID=UPI002E126B77|nr:phosphatase PAP2 family protein [Arenibaculum sp.]